MMDPKTLTGSSKVLSDPNGEPMDSWKSKKHPKEEEPVNSTKKSYSLLSMNELFLLTINFENI